MAYNMVMLYGLELILKTLSSSGTFLFIFFLGLFFLLISASDDITIYRSGVIKCFQASAYVYYINFMLNANNYDNEITTLEDNTRHPWRTFAKEGPRSHPHRMRDRSAKKEIFSNNNNWRHCDVVKWQW